MRNDAQIRYDVQPLTANFGNRYEPDFRNSLLDCTLLFASNHAPDQRDRIEITDCSDADFRPLLNQILVYRAASGALTRRASGPKGRCAAGG